MSDQEKVFLFNGTDPEMNNANKMAQDEFRYFWREISWERRRIVPALDLECVKIAFRTDSENEEAPSFEHMWVGEIDFDGEMIKGTLLNSPNWISTIKEGDSVTKPLSEVGDWMFAINGKVYGGFTVNLMRSRMTKSELSSHDSACGLDFGDPFNIQLEYKPEEQKKKSFLSIFKKDRASTSLDSPEHPMSLNMGDSLKEQLSSSKELLEYIDENGFSILHQEAMAGNSTSVKVLLDHGANKKLKTNKGDTPVDLAKKMNWQHVVEVLEQ